MEKKDKKKKSWGFLIFIIVCLLGVVGGLWYFNYYIPKEYTIEDSSKEIETKVIWAGPGYNLYEGGYDISVRELIKEYIYAMENSDAHFFIGEIDAKTENEIDFGFGYNKLVLISETDKENFEKYMGIEANSITGPYGSDIKYFLNNDNETVADAQDGVSEASSRKNLFGNTDSVTQNINDAFGTNIKDYFRTHDLSLKCDKVTIEKICGTNTADVFCTIPEEGKEYYDDIAYSFVIGTAEVTTERAIGDMSDMGIFGQEGETVTVRFVASGNNREVSSIYLERVE